MASWRQTRPSLQPGDFHAKTSSLEQKPSSPSLHQFPLPRELVGEEGKGEAKGASLEGAGEAKGASLEGAGEAKGASLEGAGEAKGAEDPQGERSRVSAASENENTSIKKGCMYVCMHACMYVCVCMYVCMCVYVCMH